ncbi:MAG: hypothetical protein K6L81_02525 [Agarilytica sp.]
MTLCSDDFKSIEKIKAFMRELSPTQRDALLVVAGGMLIHQEAVSPERDGVTSALLRARASYKSLQGSQLDREVRHPQGRPDRVEYPATPPAF